ncbi:MAG: hypothetical protein WA294_21550 [Acidobacteriaceae bacterium]
MAKTDPEIVREVLDRMAGQTNEAKAREIARVPGKRIRQRARQGFRGTDASGSSVAAGDLRRSRQNGSRYAPLRIQGEPLSSTILRDRGTD